MILMREDWNLRNWYDWLETEMDLKSGRDYRWAWVNNRWAIDFVDPKMETAVLLKMKELP